MRKLNESIQFSLKVLLKEKMEKNCEHPIIFFHVHSFFVAEPSNIQIDFFFRFNKKTINQIIFL